MMMPLVFERVVENPESGDGELFANDRYVVIRRRFEPDGDGPPLVWLSIRTQDRMPARDFRDLQAIKNQLIGPEHEAVELYPAESRLADCANQTHLWAFDVADFRWPFGFRDRAVATPEEAARYGAVQRPFDD